MSYDLLVFDPAAAPRKHDAFIAWFEKQVDWEAGRSYTDPLITAPYLRAWYEEMRRDFPNMNGPDACDIEAEDGKGRLRVMALGIPDDPAPG